MMCEFCEGKTIKKHVTKHHWLNGKLYIVENVEAEVCLDCGEKYYHVKTLKAIDQYLSKKHKIKEQMNVEVVAM